MVSRAAGRYARCGAPRDVAAQQDQRPQPARSRLLTVHVAGRGDERERVTCVQVADLDQHRRVSGARFPSFVTPGPVQQHPDAPAAVPVHVGRRTGREVTGDERRNTPATCQDDPTASGHGRPRDARAELGGQLMETIEITGAPADQRRGGNEPLAVEQAADLPHDRAQVGHRGIERDVVQALGELRTARTQPEGEPSADTLCRLVASMAGGWRGCAPR